MLQATQFVRCGIMPTTPSQFMRVTRISLCAVNMQSLQHVPNRTVQFFYNVMCTQTSSFIFFFFSFYFIICVLDFADDIVEPFTVQESNHTTGAVKIAWKEPEDPNGIIIKYQLELRRADIPNVREIQNSKKTKTKISIFVG